jgi:hypothetical protein
LQHTGASAIIRPMKTVLLFRLIPALTLTVATLLADPVDARQDRFGADATGFAPAFAPQAVAERRISLQQAVERVQRATGGRVLDAKDLGDHYRVKVLTRSGEVRIVVVDAASGDMK